MKSSKKEGRRERRTFTPEFKAEAVRMASEREAGVSLAHVARQLDVWPPQLRTWMEESGLSQGKRAAPRGETLEEEVRRLRREVAVLQQEKAFAKKVAAYFAKESR